MVRVRRHAWSSLDKRAIVRVCLLRCVSFVCRQARDARHHGFCNFHEVAELVVDHGCGMVCPVVDVPFAVHVRWSSRSWKRLLRCPLLCTSGVWVETVLKTVEVPQLQYFLSRWSMSLLCWSMQCSPWRLHRRSSWT